MALNDFFMLLFLCFFSRLTYIVFVTSEIDVGVSELSECL